MKQIESLPITSKMLLVFLSLLLTNCAQITVTGLTQGERDGQTVTVSNHQIKQGKIKTVNRVQKFQGQPFFDSVDNLAIQLSVSERNNPPDFNEIYYYLIINSSKEEIAGGTTDDPNYVPNNIGKLSYLKINQRGDSVEAVPQLGDAHVGASWLARVEDNDRKIPWLITDGNNCFPLGGGDCFDMESLSRLLFGALTESVESGVRANIPLVQNIHHRLHFVPQVSHPGVGLYNRPAKGFGFIYHAQINVPFANFKVYVPINILFVVKDDQYILVIDPLELDAGEQQTIEKIYVKENLLGGFDLNISENIIRDNIVEVIRSAPLPMLIPDIEFSKALLTAINGAAGNPATLPSNFNMLLTPTGDNRDLDNTILWDQPVVGSVLNFNQVELFFLE